MATVQQEKSLTLEEFLALPEAEPSLEYIDGRVVQKPMPKAKHSRLQKSLCQRLDGSLMPAFEAFPELRCTFAGRSLVPDVAVLKREQIPRDPGGEIGNDVFVAPYMTAEILSPDQRISELVEKAGFCVNHGVQLAWVIDPETKRIVVFRPDDLPRPLGAADTLEDPNLLPGFRLPVAELFGWLRLAGEPEEAEERFAADRG